MMRSQEFISKFPWATYGRLEATSDFLFKYVEQCGRVSLLKKTPKISLVVVDNGRDLEKTIQSVQSQSYPHWELLITTSQAGVSSPDDRIKQLSGEFANRATAKNWAVARAQGEWVGFIEAGDILSPVTLFSIVREMEKQSCASLLFTNEASLDLSTKRLSHFVSRPDLHWFNLSHLNAVGGFWVTRTDLLCSLGKFDESLKTEEEFEFFQRFEIHGGKAAHLPMYLYYRTQKEREDIIEKRLVVEKALRRRGLDAFVHSLSDRLDVQPLLKNPKDHLVSVIILFKDKVEWTLKAIDHLAKQKGQTPIEVILVNNNSSEDSKKKVIETLKKYPFEIKLVDYCEPFNFGHINNWAIRGFSKGDLLLLLNNDVFLSGENQIDLMASWTEMAWVGTVGIRLHFEHGMIQHSGLDARFGGNARFARVGNGGRKDTFAYVNHLVFGNTFACCMLKRSTFDSLGGFRELDLANGFGDVAFNFECLTQGLKNVYLGSLQGVHLESASRGLSYEYWEECILERDYPALLQRMLREDLAIDRIPGPERDLFESVKGPVLDELRVRAPWLKDVKRFLKNSIHTIKRNPQLEA